MNKHVLLQSIIPGELFIADFTNILGYTSMDKHMSIQIGTSGVCLTANSTGVPL